MPYEYQDLQDMVQSAELFPCQTVRDQFTWSNRHKDVRIYSKIDHVLENVNWFLMFDTVVLKP